MSNLVKETDNLVYFYKALTSGMVEVMSGGKIPKMSHDEASGLIGSWIVETGKPGLEGLDVVEKGNNNAGRGLSQYTGVRRGPYDTARAEALSKGVDVEGAEWQFKYFVDEYKGKHDVNGASMIGWTKVFENAPKGMSAEQAAKYYTGSAQEAVGYFRPGIPHTDRRMKTALAVSTLMHERQKRTAIQPASVSTGASVANTPISIPAIPSLQ